MIKPTIIDLNVSRATYQEPAGAVDEDPWHLATKDARSMIVDEVWRDISTAVPAPKVPFT
jgi:hypothetical protein